MKPLIITGCQRSGTAYIAASITASGYWCSHERFFRETEWQQPRPSTIEASWAALPHVVDADAHVVHQIRHPLPVVASLLARKTFDGAGRRSARWAAKRLPLIRNDDDTVIHRCMRYWLEWNLLAEERSHFSWRVDDLTPETVAEVLSECGRPVTAKRVAAGVAVLPDRINEWPGVAPLAWDDLPDGKLKRRIREAAERWGYV